MGGRSPSWLAAKRPCSCAGSCPASVSPTASHASRPTCRCSTAATWPATSPPRRRTAPRFRRPLTYASLSFEQPDWRAFDIVGVDHYRDDRVKDRYLEMLEPRVATDLPVVVSEVGMSTYGGASASGALGFGTTDTTSFVLHQTMPARPRWQLASSCLGAGLLSAPGNSPQPEAPGSLPGVASLVPTGAPRSGVPPTSQSSGGGRPPRAWRTPG
jgi:hypothetical protein